MTREWTAYVCSEGHLNGTSWNTGACEECFATTRPVKVRDVAGMINWLAIAALAVCLASAAIVIGVIMVLVLLID